MKAGLILTLVFAIVAGSAFAQTIKRKKSVKQEEVPVTIVIALQKDFGGVAEKGNWTLLFQENTYSGKFTPLFYVFTGKNESGKRVEISYKADGSLDHAKGITAAGTVAQ